MKITVHFFCNSSVLTRVFLTVPFACVAI
ncbi:hypothetical protein D917_05794 [Trichinella nativa]|uniref:Uncharacterized protein n=1 Tax=Trichinella nativa TaxID=6335 RepID=A0A1Y3EYQ8_9BILA|nr:hypothetical protein D917_05794 [Trichinella nativa]